MIKDSGARREFETGAVRDIAEGKGRWICFRYVIGKMTADVILENIEKYIRTGAIMYLFDAIDEFAEIHFENIYTAFLEVSKQYEEGAKKYSERNWEKGIPVHCFIDSGARHYLKWLRGDKDEPHDRAFIWNMLGAIWTHENHPELIDTIGVADE